MTTTPEIAIIGGGPGGLTLASILRTKGIHATIYERETSANSRDQGGSLDIHDDSGQKALEAAGLIDQFWAAARKEGQCIGMLDKFAKVHFFKEAEENDTHRPEIDRPVLRGILLNSVKPENIKWQHNVKKISPIENGRHTITFDNGVTATADAVIGADGAWSRVRALISPAVPVFSGITFVELTIPTSSASVDKLVGHGSIMALGDNKGVLAQRNGDGSVRVYLAFRTDEKWLSTCGINFNDPKQAKARLMELFVGWDASLLELVHDCNDQFVPRPVYALPIGLKWETKENVTLLGDAAHLMSPFAGEGVNQAMHDALELALAISDNPMHIKEALRAYETTMFERTSHFADESAENLGLMFCADAPKPMVDKFKYFMELMEKGLLPPKE